MFRLERNSSLFKKIWSKNLSNIVIQEYLNIRLEDTSFFLPSLTEKKKPLI